MSSVTERFDLSGKTAVVTGASAGLGITFAEALAASGANVVLAARRVEKLQEVADRIAANGGTAMVQPCDVTDEAQVHAMVAAAAERFGRIDVMVANAGLVPEAAAVPEKIPGLRGTGSSLRPFDVAACRYWRLGKVPAMSGACQWSHTVKRCASARWNGRFCGVKYPSAYSSLPLSRPRKPRRSWARPLNQP